MKVVVGLGNPGREYVGTRHNIGFDVLAELANRFQAPKPKVKFEAEVSEIVSGSERILLIAPLTYMNLSGRSVRQVLDFYKLTPGDVLVVCDDMNLPLGKLRIRKSGSAGGQKGLDNILQQLGTQDVARLRIGVDAPKGGRPARDWVLAPFAKSDGPAVRMAVEDAASAAEVWWGTGVEAAMNRYNGDPEARTNP